jgi:hypothetical protein
MRACRHFIALSVLGCIAAMGCGGGGSGGPGSISGAMTLDGQPLAGATLRFHQQTTGSEVATARTDDSGKYTLVAPAPGKAAIKPGNYTVTAKKMTDKKGNVPDPEMIGMLEAEGNLVNKLPAKYSEPATSDLKVEVKADTKTLPTLDVKSK